MKYEEDHNWVEDGVDIMQDKDYRCSKCKAWASTTHNIWSSGGCPGKKESEGE